MEPDSNRAVRIGISHKAPHPKYRSPFASPKVSSCGSCLLDYAKAPNAHVVFFICTQTPEACRTQALLQAGIH
eukprot:10473765-Karenia_brevis.AAC.1